jgi:hypothetical protein
LNRRSRRSKAGTRCIAGRAYHVDALRPRLRRSRIKSVILDTKIRSSETAITKCGTRSDAKSKPRLTGSNACVASENEDRGLARTYHDMAGLRALIVIEVRC